MILAQFFKEFPDEEACKRYLKLSRESTGIICKKCKNNKHYWLQSKEQWQCEKCKFRTTLRSGTLFESSKLKLHIWFQAIFMICNNKKAISSCEVQRQLGMKRNEPVWYMIQKIRKTMSEFNSHQQESGELQMNDSFFITMQNVNINEEPFILSGQEKIRTTKRDKALVIVERTSEVSNCKRIKFNRLRLINTQEIIRDNLWVLETNEGLKSIKYTNGRYKKVQQYVMKEPFIPISLGLHGADLWLNKLVENARRIFKGIYHHISSKFAQLYFDEFSFKYNHRWSKSKWEIILRYGLSAQW